MPLPFHHCWRASPSPPLRPLPLWRRGTLPEPLSRPLSLPRPLLLREGSSEEEEELGPSFVRSAPSAATAASVVWRRSSPESLSRLLPREGEAAGGKGGAFSRAGVGAGGIQAQAWDRQQRRAQGQERLPEVRRKRVLTRELGREQTRVVCRSSVEMRRRGSKGRLESGTVQSDSLWPGGRTGDSRARMVRPRSALP